ncbi:hypothetical protein [Serratia sp. Se-RSBMAAmG]|uniref:hypothetical protein n=1 Tax=Serratia sp. Se-RSBMAAmG TaxID=3043305 RepID=UPI0024AFF8EA|nr:hypothetical protein [Serratia sp. Se-RSBMAAmG]MDI6976569.1 hypothetical protein [Serratia sp. Se-RSBMAAmG]
MYKKNSFPANAFPNLTNAEISVEQYSFQQKLTPKQKSIINMLKKGARLLFDLKAKRAIVLYEYIDGVKKLTELSVRMLSSLIKQGFLKVYVKENGRVHYQLCKPF